MKFTRDPKKNRLNKRHHGISFKDIPEMTEADFARAIRHSTLLRLRAGDLKSGEDIAAFRRYVGMSQSEFAQAMEISAGTLRGWEQGRRKPEGPAMALLKMVARHPRLVRENLKRLEKSTGAVTFDDIHKLTFPDGPPPPATVEEMDEAIGRGLAPSRKR